MRIMQRRKDGKMKSIKRMMAIVIAMVIALALGTATFADNTTTQVQTTTAKGAGSFDITMKGAEDGHKFSAYRIFDGAVDTEGKLSEISWATGVNTSGIASDLATAGLPDTAGGKTLDLSNAEDVATALATLTDDTETVQKVADVFYSRIGSAAGTADSKTGSTALNFRKNIFLISIFIRYIHGRIFPESGKRS